MKVNNIKVIQALKKLSQWDSEVYKPSIEELERLKNENDYLTLENKRMREMNLKLLKQREQLKKNIRR